MKPLIVANWKMNPPNQKEAKRLFSLVKNRLRKVKRTEAIICPPFLYLSMLDGSSPGSQNCFWEKKGAYTGEVSPAMLRNLGCKYVIVGHSERRKYLAETDEMINKKIKAALKEKLNPILCVGETRTERDRGKTETVLKRQIISDLKNISGEKISKGFTIAYEPVWAIGTGNPCDIEEAQKMGLLIRKIISGLYSSTISKKIRILYGGSVNSKNAAAYIKEAGFQGLLVGGASLDAKEFIQIVKSAI